MTDACAEVLRRLGDRAQVVEAFRVTFSEGTDGNPNSAGVRIRIHFSNPSGEKSSHTTDYEITPSLGSGESDYRVVANAICNGDFLADKIAQGSDPDVGKIVDALTHDG